MSQVIRFGSFGTPQLRVFFSRTFTITHLDIYIGGIGGERVWADGHVSREQSVASSSAETSDVAGTFTTCHLCLPLWDCYWSYCLLTVSGHYTLLLVPMSCYWSYWAIAGLYWLLLGSHRTATAAAEDGGSPPSAAVVRGPRLAVNPQRSILLMLHMSNFH